MTDLNDVIEAAKELEREWRELEKDEDLNPSYANALYSCSLQMRFLIRDLKALRDEHRGINRDH